MLRRLLKRYAFWAIAIILGVWIMSTSQAFHSCVHERKNDERYRALHQSPSIIIRTVVRADLAKTCAGDFADKDQGAITAIATAVVAFFTFTLWRATSGMLSAATEQGSAMERSLREASRSADAIASVAASMLENVQRVREVVVTSRETAATNREIADRQKILGETQLRAYVCTTVSNTATFQDRANNILFGAGVNINNTGQTPAYKVKQKIAAAILPTPLPSVRDFELLLPSGEPSDEDLFPPHSGRSITAMVDRYVADSEVPMIKRAQGQALYVWGVITYEDAFFAKHETKFCHLLTWLPPGPNGIEPIWGYYMAGRNTMRQISPPTGERAAAEGKEQGERGTYRIASD